MFYMVFKLVRLSIYPFISICTFCDKNHISSKNNPQMYGWVSVDINNNASGVSVKTPISDNPYEDHAIVGTFWFRKVEYFNNALQSLKDKNIRVNGEYYVDSLLDELIKFNFNVKVFEVDNYVCWGTPNDYETFNYWQSFFDKTSWHPYSLDLDKSVDKDSIKSLRAKFQDFSQQF